MSPFAIGGAVGGLVLGLITSFKKTCAPVTAPMYALVESVFIGALSGIFKMRYPGIVVQAFGLTFGTMVALLLAYCRELIRATEKFRLGIVAATGGAMLLYLANMAMSFFGHPIGFINGHSTVGILFSVVVVVIAALNLILDFDMIESGVNQRRRPEIHGVVGRICAGGNAGVAVPGTAAAAVEDAVTQLKIRPGDSFDRPLIEPPGARLLAPGGSPITALLEQSLGALDHVVDGEAVLRQQVLGRGR